MTKNTIEQAIIEVLKNTPQGLTPSEITDKIIEKKLYAFKAKSPTSVVHQTLRKSCQGVQNKASKDDKQFVKVGMGKYCLIN